MPLTWLFNPDKYKYIPDIDNSKIDNKANIYILLLTILFLEYVWKLERIKYTIVEI